jgi:glutathione peroxidase
LPLHGFLKEQRKGALGSKNIKWNFTKFLIDREGNVTERYGPDKKPETIEADIEKLL